MTTERSARDLVSEPLRALSITGIDDLRAVPARRLAGIITERARYAAARNWGRSARTTSAPDTASFTALSRLRCLYQAPYSQEKRSSA
ncbi:hypothetical protein MRX96_057126 [Rhipicephalus microplus]